MLTGNVLLIIIIVVGIISFILGFIISKLFNSSDSSKSLLKDANKEIKELKSLAKSHISKTNEIIVDIYGKCKDLQVHNLEADNRFNTTEVPLLEKDPYVVEEIKHIDEKKELKNTIVLDK